MPTPIPRLTQTGNGFGGFAVNPSIPYPGGRVLTSDVDQATEALNFGGGPSQRFNPTPTPPPVTLPSDFTGPYADPNATPIPFNSPTPVPTTPPGDNSNAGLVSHEIRDFYNGEFPRSYWQDAPQGDNIGINAGVDYTPSRAGTGRPPSLTDDPNSDWTGVESPTYAGPGGRPPGITTDPNEDWTGTNPRIDPTVELYAGGPNSGSVPVWWDANNTGTNRIGPQPWWVGFNTSIGNNLNTSLTDLGYGDRPSGGVATSDYTGPVPTALADIPWADTSFSDYTPPASERTSPDFVDPGSGLEPTDTSSGTRGTNTAGRNNIVVPTSSEGAPPGMTVIGHDSVNGQPIYRDTAGHLYVNPGTGTMDQTSRFSENSVTGNFTADKTTDAFVAAGGYAGSPNRQVAPDSGHDTFTGATGRLDPETGIISRVASTSPGMAFTMSQKSGAPTLRAGDPKSAAAYNAWLMQQPEWKAFMQRMLGAGATPSFQTGSGPLPRSGSGGG